MSGGVDSSVSALLLLEQGYEVIGAFMKNWSGDVGGSECTLSEEKIGEMFESCGWRQERRDAMRVAAKLGIPFLTFDFEKEYRRDVVEYLFKEYEAGRTPNPDVMCNKYIKFDLFLKEADKLGCDFIATGHYARLDSTAEDHIKILMAKDQNKDQTYFLWAINKNVLPRVLFPLGDLLKPQVREIARKHELHVATKKDSTGICFIGEVEIQKFLEKRIAKDPGLIITTEGKVIGKHSGIAYYTIGQRHGLSIGGGGGAPYYVAEKRPATKELIVSSNYHQALFHKHLLATELNWFSKPTFTISCEARIRYRQPLEECTLEKKQENQWLVHFNRAQRAITPGQSIVFYKAEEMIGGGIIEDRYE